MKDSKFRALVVDDSKVMRMMVMKGVRQADLGSFAFDEACDGQEALEKFDSVGYDIVFVDWNMPRMNGVDFVRAIREERENDKVAIVMVSSEKSTAKIHEAIEDAGADTYVAKPFTPESIALKLVDVMDRLREQVEPPREAKKKTGLSRWLS